MTLLSCKSQNTINNNITKPNKNDLSVIEINIVNDFLTEELKKDRYKYKKNYNLVVIEEAIKKQKSISTYEFNYKYKESWGKFINEWIIDSLHVEKIKKELENEEVYHWKESDFKNFKVGLLKFEDLIKTTNTGEYLRGNLIIFISRPLIINKKTAFISFDIGNGDFGNYAITHFTVLMKKVKNKWIDNGHYEDGVF